MIVADILGCLGICSAIGNLVGWGTAVGAAEGSIAAVTAELEELEVTVKTIVKDDIGLIKDRTDKMIKLLEREVDIIARWSNNAVNLNRKLHRVNDLSKFDRLPHYREALTYDVKFFVSFDPLPALSRLNPVRLGL